MPIGLVFGMLSTRGLTGRVRRLAGVTTAVAAGDYRPRVTVRGSDEVSTLEHSVNLMADRLGAAVEAARTSAGGGQARHGAETHARAGRGTRRKAADHQ